MSVAQDYIDALREGRYAKVLDFVEYCTSQHQDEHPDSIVAGDDVVSAIVKQLLTTNFGKDDRDITYFNQLATLNLGFGLYGYLVTSLTSSMIFTLGLSDTQRKELCENPELNIAPENDISNLVDWDLIVESDEAEKLKLVNNESDSLSPTLAEEINKPIYAEVLQFNKDNPGFQAVSIDDYPEAQRDKIAAEQQDSAETQQLLTEVINYCVHLKGKMINSGYMFWDDDSRYVAPNDGSKTEKMDKLEKRFDAMYSIANRLSEKKQVGGLYLALSQEDKQKTRDAVDACRKNKPDWRERSFLQKITDVISLGTKALVRFFCSKEKSFRKNIEAKAQNINPRP